ncbi:hypothetical protein BZZ01_20595 [Nostocales cyanobacterium HT-58-2]|nr:hypothetical protein BZZ01_20595 [Nostocales cyanobacterium HT-58-2]
MNEPDIPQQSECLEKIEQDKLLEPGIKETKKEDNALVETAELLSAVGDLTRDSYIHTVKQARSFIENLHKRIRLSQEEGDSQQ